MKNILIRLRIKFSICLLSVKIFLFRITEPFIITFARLKRFMKLTEIDRECSDGWERHVKRRELINQDELAVRREEFYLLKTRFIGVFTRTIIFSRGCDVLEEAPDELEHLQEEFKKNKEELISFLEKICDYEEINFDEKIKSEIISWEFETYKTQEEFINWIKTFSEYMGTLDIIET